MRFAINGPFRENVHNLMRRVGYWFQRRDEAQGEMAFVRPARGFPRFHLFVKQEGENLVFNLHLDQKKPSYKGSRAHSGEHHGEVVEKEAQRIKVMVLQ